MDNLERKLDELEKSITEAEQKVVHAAHMPDGVSVEPTVAVGKTCFPYVYVIGGIVPLVVIAALFFVRPKWVQRRNKVDWSKLLKWAAIITAIGWVVLFVINYFGAFNKLQNVCFSSCS